MLRMDESYDGQETTLTIGQEFEVLLPEDPQLDFHWRFAANGWPVCELRDEYFEQSIRLQTSGGSRVWRFQARQVGSATIHLVYEKQGEPEEVSQRSFSLHVVVS